MVKKKDNNNVVEEVGALLKEAEDVTKKARRHNHPLHGRGFYASKFFETHAQATVILKELSQLIDGLQNSELTKVMAEVMKLVDDFFDPSKSSKVQGEILKRITFLLVTKVKPATARTNPCQPSDDLFPLDIVRGTRGYIEKIAEQACGCYDSAWYDATSVMCRRLLETLIIEVFEAEKIADTIKNADGTFFYLSQLIPALLKEKTWNIGRNVVQACPQLKDLGNASAHSRRYLAKKPDIDKIKRELRITIEELVHLAKFK